MIEDKDAEIRNWEKKYNELYISNLILTQVKQKLSQLRPIISYMKPN